MRIRLKAHSGRVGLLVVALAAIGATVTLGATAALGAFAHGGNTDLIHVCARHSTGQVLFVGANQNCHGFLPAHAWTPIHWSMTGPSGLNGATGASGAAGASGPSGPAGTAGPTSLEESPGFAVPGAPGAVYVSHTVLPAQAGLTIITAPVQVQDLNATMGGLTRVGCTVRLNGVDLGAGYGLTVVDTLGDINHPDTTSVTFIRRVSLATNDVVAVNCLANGGDEGDAGAIVQLLLQRVDS